MLAAIVSPLSILVAVPVGVAAAELAHGQLPDFLSTFPFAMLLMLFAYPATLLFGLPLFFVLRRLRLDSIWVAAGIGYLVAALVPVLLVLESSFEISRSGIPPTIAFNSFRSLISQPLLILLDPLALLGPVVGVVFWLIANSGLDQNK